MDGEIDRAAVWAAALGAKVATEPAPEARPAGPGG
jgi:hypothetical protein